MWYDEIPSKEHNIVWLIRITQHHVAIGKRSASLTGLAHREPIGARRASWQSVCPIFTFL